MFSKVTIGDEKVRSADIDKFVDIYQKFIAGTKWIEDGYARRGWNSWRRTHDPQFEKEIKSFVDTVLSPLDALWASFSSEERIDAEAAGKAAVAPF